MASLSAILQVKDVDQDSLLENARKYAEHMDAAFADGGKGSLLCQFYKHFQRVENGQNFVVMNNFLPTKGANHTPQFTST